MFVLIFIILLILKVCGVGITWFAVFFPLLIIPMFIAVVFVLGGMIMIWSAIYEHFTR